MKNLNRIVRFLLPALLVAWAHNSGISQDRRFPASPAWDEWRLPTEDGASLFVREFGTGDTVTVLHGGWGAEHSYLIEALSPLANRYHFIFYDQRGSLRSHCPDSTVSVTAHVADLERIRKATGQDKLLLVGHSMGGFLGMNYLQEYQANVKGIVLISSTPAKGSVKQLTEDITPSALERWKRPEVVDTLRAHGLEVERRPGYTPRQRGMWHRITFAALNMHHVRNWPRLQGAFYFQQEAGGRAAASSPSEWDFTDALRKSAVPIAVIHGDDDYLPLDYQKAWAPSVPNAELIILPNAGHSCWIDQPEEFRKALLAALKKCGK